MVGKPLIYTTSRHFMDYFGINSSEELPKISEVLAEQVIMPTLVNAEHFEVDADQSQEFIVQNEDTTTDPKIDGDENVESIES
jgi:segregation and condensation protein B